MVSNLVAMFGGGGMSPVDPTTAAVAASNLAGMFPSSMEFYMDSSDVFVNKHAPYPNEIDSLNSFNWHENKVRTEKLKCTSYIFLLYLFVYLINHL